MTFSPFFLTFYFINFVKNIYNIIYFVKCVTSVFTNNIGINYPCRHILKQNKILKILGITSSS